MEDLLARLPGWGEVTLKWPSADVHLRKWIHQHKHIDNARKWCRGRRTVVQAGGACGVWPLVLSKHFERVYTFEPYPPSFRCLARNIEPADNIVALHAAVGDRRGLVHMEWKEGHEANLGAQFVAAGGMVPTLRIDDLGLDSCDLLILDVEGYEGPALMGAAGTIKRYKPVIMLELCGHSERFGWNDKRVLSLLSDYRPVKKERDDVVLVPK